MAAGRNQNNTYWCNDAATAAHLQIAHSALLPVVPVHMTLPWLRHAACSKSTHLCQAALSVPKHLNEQHLHGTLQPLLGLLLNALQEARHPGQAAVNSHTCSNCIHQFMPKHKLSTACVDHGCGATCHQP